MTATRDNRDHVDGRRPVRPARASGGPNLRRCRLHAFRLRVEIDSRDVFIYRYALENGAASTRRASGE